MSIARLARLALSREALSSAAVCGALLVAALVVSTVGGKALQATAANGFVLLILVSGLGIFVGSTGILSFGHASFAAIAGYATALLTIPTTLKLRLLPELPAWLSTVVLSTPASIAVAVTVATLVGATMGVAIVRLSGASAVIATLGLLIISNSVLIGAVDYTRGAQAIYGIPGSVGLWSTALAACGAYVIARAFKDSARGLVARAARDDAVSARSVGISQQRARLVPWTLSVTVVALGGAMMAHRLTVISPKEFYFGQSFEWLVVLIVGGMLSVSGNVLGAAAIVALVEVLRRIEEGIQLFGIATPQVFGLTDAGMSLAILVTLIKRGAGIAGTWEFDHLKPFGRWPSVIQVLANAVTESTQEPPRPGTTLTIEQLSKSYGGVQALSEVSMQVQAGSVVGLIGPNGSGKSTLLGCVSGLLKASTGVIRIGNRTISGCSPESIVRCGIARTFQNIRLFGTLTVAENIEAALLGSGLNSARGDSHRAALEILDRNGLAHLADRVASTLSYGDQRRVEIARALACNPQFLLLDEPAAGMNEGESMVLADLLRDLRARTGIGILVVEHDLSFVTSLCDHIVVLEKGQKIAAGSARQILKDARVHSAYLGHSNTERSSAQFAT